MRGRFWFWLVVTWVNVMPQNARFSSFSTDLKSLLVHGSQQHCPESCLQCDQNMRCMKCIDGYYGERCNMACDPGCARCRMDGLCDDNINKADRKMTRRRRDTPANCHDEACTCCVSNYRGTNCQVRCPNCRTRYMSGECNHYCEAGFHGVTCDDACPQNCAPGNAGKPLCKQATGECSNNCKIGYFGKTCNKPCPSDCKDNICLPVSGSCSECIDKRYGESCEEKCQFCKDKCYKNGTCVGGCEDGYYGKLCNLRCGTGCSEGTKCRLYKADHENICSDPCQYIPESQNLNETCVPVQKPVQRSSDAGMIAGIGVGIGIIIIIIVGIAIFYFLRRRKLCCWRGPNVVKVDGPPPSTERRDSNVAQEDDSPAASKRRTSEDKTTGNNSDDLKKPLLGEGTSEDKTTGNSSDDPKKPLLAEGRDEDTTTGSDSDQPKKIPERSSEDKTTGSSSDGPETPPNPERTVEDETTGSNSDGSEKPPNPERTSQDKTTGSSTDSSQKPPRPERNDDRDVEDGEPPPGIVGEKRRMFEGNK
ncbi:scavenger receptor class F member 1-like isoform X2 [Haliotis asinina]|uniref:scavenger receptor class F member 1-like isoform X2 n=1 Tax=Haliotis asinina TaxID=109174 RepID=UPI0035319D7E